MKRGWEPQINADGRSLTSKVLHAVFVSYKFTLQPHGTNKTVPLNCRVRLTESASHQFIAQDDSFEYACRALGELKVKEAVPEIKNLREQTNDAIHLIFLDTALSMLDDPDANTRILNVLKNGESPTEVFRTACRAATQLRLKEAVPLLKPYLRSECYYTRLITLRGVLCLEYNEP